MSFNHARLCVQRSNTLPLKLQLYTYTLKQRSDLGTRFYDVLQPIASRIRVLITYMTTYNGLKIVRTVLERLEMPTLEEIDLDYDSMFHGGPNRAITIPGGGTTLRTLTLTGLFPNDSNLSNLKSLTLGSAASWEWSIARIYTLVRASPALENLTFIGGESTFDVEGDVTEFTLLCPSLRSLAMKGGISANFTTIIFLAIDAPNLETIHATTPSISYETGLGAPVHWDQVIDQFEERDAEGTSTIGQVRSLVIDPEDEGYSPRQNRAFFRFLMASLPRITSLDLDRLEIGVLNICNEENDFDEKGWERLTTLMISGGPSPHALKRVLHFVRVRNGSSRGDLGEEFEESGEVYSEDEDEDDGDETDDYDDEMEEDEDESEDSGSEVGNGAAEGDEGVSNNIHESSGAAGGGSDVDEDEVYSDLTPIETLVIKDWTMGDAVGDGIIRGLKDEVQSLVIVRSNSVA